MSRPWNSTGAHVGLLLPTSYATAIVIARAKPVPELQRPDIVLAADCVYFEPAFPLLVSTLATLIPPPPEPAPEVLFCYKKRRKADKRFFALLKKYFTWNIVRGIELRIRHVQLVCTKFEGR